jgi:hypothetical protein
MSFGGVSAQGSVASLTRPLLALEMTPFECWKVGREVDMPDATAEGTPDSGDLLPNPEGIDDDDSVRRL